MHACKHVRTCVRACLPYDFGSIYLHPIYTQLVCKIVGKQMRAEDLGVKHLCEGSSYLQLQVHLRERKDNHSAFSSLSDFTSEKKNRIFVHSSEQATA